MGPRLPSLLRPLLHSHRLSEIVLSRQNPHSLSLLRVPAQPISSPSSPPSPLLFFLRFDADPFPLSSRAFSSSPSPSNVVLVGSADAFNTALSKVQDEKLPGIFYFTAVWCGPCRMISPVIEEMSKKLPHVTIYKIDIDQEGFGSILSQLKIYSVPTFHFFQNGKKAIEIVGADVARLKDTMENLYK